MVPANVEAFYSWINDMSSYNFLPINFEFYFDWIGIKPGSNDDGSYD